MMRMVMIAAAVLSVSLSAQPIERRSTLCQAAEVVVHTDISERRLLGCGDGFPDNLLWHLDRSDDADGVLDRTVVRKTSGRGAVIYVADTGVMQAHDEFVRDGGPNVIAGIDAGGPAACDGAVLSPCYLASSPGTILLFGHGTGVASIAAGRTTGVAPDASVVSVLAVGDAAVWLNALLKIIEHAFDPSSPVFRTGIINISGGVGESTIPAEVDALLARMTTGVNREGEADPEGKRFLIVAAAGNFDVDPKVTQCGPDRSVINYPARVAANIDGVISVGGIDRENRLWEGSCAGPLVEVAAPAADMLVASIFATDTYRFKPDFYVSGTSWAAPYVSGMAARLLEMNPDLTPADLERILRASPSSVEGIPVPVLVEEVPVHGPRRRAARH